VGKESVAIPQKGGYQKMVASLTTVGLIRSQCRRGSGGSRGDKRKGQPTKELTPSFRT